MFQPNQATDPLRAKDEKALYRHELWRLHTFVNYPRGAPVSSLLLARQGFIYIGSGTGDSDTSIMCIFCSLVLKSLDEGVDIEKVHRTLRPDCASRRDGPSQNILLEPFDGESTHLFSQLQSHPTDTDLPSSSTGDVRSYEAEVLSSEMDVPENAVAPAAVLTNDSVQKPVSDHHAHQSSTHRNLIPPSSSVHGQATDRNHTSKMVTTRAQTLSFPGQDSVTDRLREVSRPDGQPVYNGEHIQTDGSDQFDQTDSHDHRDGHDQHDGHSQHEGHEQYNGQHHQDGHDHHNGQVHDNGHDQHDGHNQHDGPGQQDGQGGNNSLEKIGIVTCRPRLPEYALELVRLQSFKKWPKDHHPKPEDLAKAGFFYTGSSDCVRCFNCGGGLRNWEVGDHVWVEHTRWFPKCSFLKQKVGNAFISIVQNLNKEQEIILYEDVIQDMMTRGLEKMIPEVCKDEQTKSELKKDAAVRLMIDVGFAEDEVIKAAVKLKAKGSPLAVDLIYEELPGNLKAKLESSVRISNTSECVRGKRDAKKDQDTMKSLKNKRSELRELSLCKMCLDKEVAVVFLPCGHFISCSDCSYAFTLCPVCRMEIKGVVNASLMS